MATIDERIERLDPTLFDHILSQTHIEDKRSLLALQAAVRAEGEYAYLEIGSYLGGSLQPFVVDPLCRRIISIDPRPDAPADSREEIDGSVQYADNSTEHMLALLDQIPGADVNKLTCIEAGSEAIDPATIAEAPALCFIDGEHTSGAALRDAIFCFQAAPRAAIVFHDRLYVREGIGAFLQVFGGYGYQLPHVLFAIEREPVLRSRSTVLRERIQRERLWEGANRVGLAGALLLGASVLKRAR